uniref:Spore coat protein n=1 Tax=candidate division CPR3 bacterium TaxID=2268181 RepID=A0A7V3J9F3_UNCC3
MIEGVIFKELKTYLDERGYFREIIRKNDEIFKEGFGQWSVSCMYPGVIKAWHIHKKQTDWWYVQSGLIKVALYDARKDSPTHGQLQEILMGDNQTPIVLKVPPGVAHGCKCINGPALLFYVTLNVYDPDDEGRIKHDDPVIGYDWLKGAVIK